jgi:hypothetical protein
MFGWLLNNLIQEVPEELSICEFDCPMSECTTRNWIGCELRQQASQIGSGITQYNSRKARIEAPAFATSNFGKTGLIKPLTGF